ncbi:MAG: CPBP family intramembrane metalloprotease [Bacteroidia bacterium]|nr:CPBP family intramembrane metalloprotease [Bacteroidia bacterium]NNF31984.1 CPBP family intramembrane metalloprotease [Flavobacteriaceae bacterium]MBT8276178.1 CPBP family intramembrane metalloprotease [Bacteroidia bacterium]NNJ81909.1 CPBP family intramembrane metalloprotease [Flavobacteriaceae bacterium]NNK52953.1 CPBP family intramembrane metalloprotease [Flavobacteriaceae bacterium]
MYIAQAYNYLHDWWRYLIPVAGLASLFVFNMAIIAIMDIDTEAFMKEQIEAKGSNRVFLENMIPFALFLGALFVWVKFVHKQTIRALTTSRKKIDWGRFGFGFFLIFIATVGTTLLSYYTAPENFVVQFDLVPFLILALITIVFIPLQTSFEEYMFRGYLMQGIGVMARNRWVPLILTSVLFGSLHFMNPEVDKLGNVIMIYYIGTGLFLGIITLMDEGLELALGFHAGNNVVASLLVTSDWTVFQTHSILKEISEPSTGFHILIPVLIMYPIFIGLMAWRYKWTGWKNKLFGNIEPPPEEETEITEMFN